MLETHLHYESDRERLRHCAQPHAQGQGVIKPENGPRDGLQADDVSQEEMAQT